MAKGNLFLGMGRGSVGDVTLYRANGEQIARARNRNPKNPQSYAQLVQRAVTASVSKAYSAGKVIFDHSFQGKAVPAGSMRRFISVNTQALRAAVVNDLNLAEDAIDCAGRVVAKGSTTPSPWTFRVSEGTLVQQLFSVAPNSENPDKLEAKYAVAAGESETVAQFAASHSLVAGDIYTIVAFGSFNEDLLNGEALLAQQSCSFGFIRLTVKEGLSEVSTLMSAAKLSDLFLIDSAGTAIPETTLAVGAINIDQVVPSATTGTMGVIRSREDSGLRSTCDLDTPLVMRWGVASAGLHAAWTTGSELTAGSDLVLEGGNF